MATPSYLRDPGSIRLLVEFGLGNGLAAPQLLARSGLKEEQLDDPLVEVEPEQELRVITNLVNLLGAQPLLGIRAGWAYGISTYGIWGFALLCGKSIGEAMTLALRFLPLTYAFCPISVRPLHGQLAVLFDEPVAPEAIRPFLIQRDMAAASRLIRSLLGEERPLSGFLYTGARPDAADIRLPADWNIDIQYDSPRNALLFDPAYLALPLPLSNPLTSAHCEQLCGALLHKRRSRQGTSALARMYLRASRARDLPELAGRLCMSERSLRRHLQAEGTCFSDILAEVRMEQAAELLEGGTHSIAQIAEALGYSDQSSFSQAYKRWHGIPPSASRKKSAQQASAAPAPLQP